MSDEPRAGRSSRGRAAPIVPALLGALLSLAASACSSVDMPKTPTAEELAVRELRGRQEPENPNDDFWTKSLGHYLSPAELQRYWLTARDQRFQRFGKRWLEFCLREDLLLEHADALSYEEVDRYCAEPDFDHGRRLLEELLAQHAKEKKKGPPDR